MNLRAILNGTYLFNMSNFLNQCQLLFHQISFGNIYISYKTVVIFSFIVFTFSLVLLSFFYFNPSDYARCDDYIEDTNSFNGHLEEKPYTQEDDEKPYIQAHEETPHIQARYIDGKTEIRPNYFPDVKDVEPSEDLIRIAVPEKLNEDEDANPGYSETDEYIEDTFQFEKRLEITPYYVQMYYDDDRTYINPNYLPITADVEASYASIEEISKDSNEVHSESEAEYDINEKMDNTTDNAVMEYTNEIEGVPIIMNDVNNERKVYARTDIYRQNAENVEEKLEIVPYIEVYDVEETPRIIPNYLPYAINGVYFNSSVKIEEILGNSNDDLNESEEYATVGENLEKSNDFEGKLELFAPKPSKTSNYISYSTDVQGSSTELESKLNRSSESDSDSGEYATVVENMEKANDSDETLEIYIPPRRKSPSYLPNTTDGYVSDQLVKFATLPETSSAVDNKCRELEARTSLQMAIRMKNSGKFDKAQKLFQHAMILQPHHADILNHYGEFVEENENDIMKADLLYVRALFINPEHSRALVNRRRTLPVVEELDKRQLDRIHTKRMQLIHSNHNDPSLKQIKKEIYFQHIHQTVAMEGNTMTLAETRLIVETRRAVPGKSILEHNEILGLEAALRYINRTLVNKNGYITVFDILQIHSRVLGNVNPEQAGTFRDRQVFVGFHTPPAASEVAYLMEEFAEWLQSDGFQQLHPVEQAALAHFKLVYIHPFIDGNGRTARLLMNLILMRAGYPPVIIKKHDRDRYYLTLRHANEGDIRPFIRFIAYSTEWTLDAYLYTSGHGTCGLKALECSKSNSNDVIALH